MWTRPSVRQLTLLTALAILPFASAGRASGQSNGTWNTDLSSTWSTASNWSGGTIPNAGGTATFNAAFGQLAARTVTNDVTGLTLSSLVFDTPFNFTITGGTITMGASGLTINSLSSSFLFPSTNTISGGSTIASQISGTGDLIKTGAGTVTLTNAANSFTGTLQINQGSLVVTSGSNGTFGNAANQILLNGGSLITATAALTTDRTFQIGANGGTIRTGSTTTLTGTLTGSGTLFKQYGSTLFLQGHSTAFTGQMVIQNGVVTLQNAGQIASGGLVDVAGTLTFDNSTTNVANRLGGRAVTLRGGSVTMTGNASAASSEAMGQLTLAQGHSTVSVTPNTAQSATLDFAGLTRLNQATVFFRGTSLGAAPAANVGAITFQSSPGTLVGGGGSPTTSTTASILPFAYGNVVAGATANSSFVTWDGTSNRIVPLDLAAGYVTDLTTATANDNVNQNTSVAGGGTTINSLRTAPASSITISGGPITIQSGAILATTATATALTTISANVSAPAGRELVIFSTAGASFDAGTTGLTLSGVISGDGGLTKSGPGAVTITNPANTFTGTTALHGGVLNLGAGTVSNDGTPSLLGQANTPVIFGGTAAFNQIMALGAVTFNRDILATTGHNSVLSLGTPGVSATESFTINGAITLTNPTGSFTGAFLQFDGNDTRDQAVTVNGPISGNAGVRAGFGAYTILNGNNSYTGGTIIGTSLLGSGMAASRETWELGSDTALGGPTSPVYVHATSPGTNLPLLAANVVAGGGARTIANPILSANGLIRFQGTNAFTLSGPVDLNGNANIEVGNTNGVTISGAIGRGTLIKDGAGTMTLTNGANTYAGQTIIKQGVLSVSTIANGGVASDLGSAPAGAAATSGVPYLVLTGGTLRYTGGTASTDRRFAISATGGTLDASGTGPLSFTSTLSNPQVNAINLGGAAWSSGSDVINIGVATTPFLAVGSVVSSVTAGIPANTTVTEVGPNFIRLSNPTTAATTTATLVVAPLPVRTLTLTGSNGGLNSLAGTFANTTYTLNSVSTTTTLALAKSGPGTWQLTGASTYSGGTAVSGGTLLVNNATGSGTGTGAVSVTAGTLGGTGIISGATTVSGGATLAPGTNAIGTLTINNTVIVGGTYAAELNAAGSAADRIVSNSLILNGATLQLTLTGTLAGTEEFVIARNVTPNTSAVTGTFAGLANGAVAGTFGGINLYVFYDQRLTGGSFTPELGVIILTPVPEPLTTLLLASGVLVSGHALRRYRRFR